MSRALTAIANRLWRMHDGHALWIVAGALIATADIAILWQGLFGS